MAFRPETFTSGKTQVAAPVKAKGEHDYVSLNITYGADKMTFFNSESLKGTRISENNKKPGQLSQGFHVTESMTKMLGAIDLEILEGVLKQKDHADMPQYVKECENVEDLLKALKHKKYKPLLHRPKKKDAKTGKPTNVPDMTVTPLVYGNMIQCGPNHKETPNKVFTKYIDIRLLEALNRNDERKKNGQTLVEVNEANFTFAAEDLFKSKTGMIAKPTITVGDVFISDSVFKIRRSLTEVYIVSFEAGESKVRKDMREELMKTGEKIEGPKLTLPSAPVASEGGSDDEGGSDEEHHSNPLPIPASTGEFKVQILGGN